MAYRICFKDGLIKKVEKDHYNYSKDSDAYIFYNFSDRGDLNEWGRKDIVVARSEIKYIEPFGEDV